ncbi:MAG: MlaD family protein [Verrucomicrobia bacterium]|nr:MlaD family protein [Verrucomicrobiota bacterium]
MDERDKKTELLVGLFLTIGLLLLGTLILQFSSVRELFKGTYAIRVTLPDGTGIKDGTPVLLGGRKIGKASDKPSFNATFTGVIIPLMIYSDIKIPADAKFSIGTSGLLGDAFLEIKPSGKASVNYIAPDTVIEGVPSGGLGALQNTAVELSQKVDVALEDMRAAIKDLREGLKKINEGVLSDSSTKELKESFKHLNNVITRLDEKTLNDDTSGDLKSAVASFKNAAKTFEESVKKLDPAFTKIDSVAAKADKVMDSADSAMKTVDKSAAAIGGAAEDMRQGDGLLSALLKDSKLREEFTALITNLREHGILRYRDDTGKSETARKDEAPHVTRPLTGTKR